jgi:hypothetical protein
MQAEEAKEPMPGAGLCPGFTISRAILADAVALTRGDRFMTVDFTRMEISLPLSILASSLNDVLQHTISLLGATTIARQTRQMVPMVAC